MDGGQKCCKCNRVKKQLLHCKSCSKYSCVTCLRKTYLQGQTPINSYYSCFKCNQLFSIDELPTTCTRAIGTKVSEISDNLIAFKPIIYVTQPYSYINQQYITDAPYNHDLMLQMVEEMHESFINGEDYELPRVLPKLPVLSRTLKPNAPPELIELESLRFPVLTGSIGELYEWYSCDILHRSVRNDYYNRIFNERIDNCINDYEAGKISRDEIAALLASLSYCKKYNDGDNDSERTNAIKVVRADTLKNELAEVTEDGDDVATEAVY